MSSTDILKHHDEHYTRIIAFRLMYSHDVVVGVCLSVDEFVVVVNSLEMKM